jgi:hypothetical protein
MLQDLRRMPSRESLGITALGGLAAAGAHTVDSQVTRRFPGDATANYKPGAVVGGTPFALGAAVATYGFGRAFDKPCAASVGADLIQAQVIAEILSTGIKQSVRRSRPEGSGFSFPSGHTTVSFASATVLQRHFGWKVGLPAYGVATYVAASRVEMKRHYLSDVAFGAALGVMVGRTVTVSSHHALAVTPIAAASGTGGGLGFSLVRKQ